MTAATLNGRIFDFSRHVPFYGEAFVERLALAWEIGTFGYADATNRDKFSDEYKLIVDALAALRKDMGLTQAELGQRLGIDQAYISKWERYERRLDILDFVRFCDACGAVPGLTLDRIRSAAQVS